MAVMGTAILVLPQTPYRINEGRIADFLITQLEGIDKTSSILRYLHNEEHRRRVQIQLNKGESIHALRADINYANGGQIRRRDSGDQDLQGECLTLLANAMSCWNTIYTAAALDHIQQQHPIADEHIARLSTATHKHVNLYGQYNFSNPASPPKGQLRQLNQTRGPSQSHHP